MSVMTSGTMESPLMGNALAEIAVLFQREWQRLHQDVVSEPLTTLRAGLLTVALPNVLSTDECARTTNASGRQQITQRLERWIDLSLSTPGYAKIELLLRCYVTIHANRYCRRQLYRECAVWAALSPAYPVT
ncbi:MAG: hypothetical protein R2867_41950 [Caldilineaceae bacterium]